MGHTNDLVIRELSPEILQDYLTFFDQDAFADNPRWASCYCYFNHAPHHLQNWEDRTRQENRAAVCQQILERQMHGYLAYDAGRPIAWCNACPRTHMTSLEEAADPLLDRIGSIACFVVASPYRRKGIARRLLQAACDGFRGKGFELAEAYPLKESASDAANHYGPLAMYLAAGFRPFREVDRTLIVRRMLA